MADEECRVAAIEEAVGSRPRLLSCIPAGDNWDSHASEAWHTGVVSGRSIGVDEFDTHGGTFFVWPTHLDWPVTIKSVLNRIARPI